MLRWIACLALLSGTASGGAPTESTPESQQTAQAASNPVPVYVDRAVKPNTPASLVEHIQAAAAHLRAAGLDDEARALDRRADEMLHSALAELAAKRELVARLQSEIQQLEKLSGVTRQIVLSCLVVQVPESSVKFLSVLGRSDAPVAADSSAVLNILSPLEYEQMRLIMAGPDARFLANSDLSVQSGKPASMMSGGRFKSNEGGDADTGDSPLDFGTRIEAVATDLSEGRIRLNVNAELCHQPLATYGKSPPAIFNSRGEMQVEIVNGQTAVLALPGPDRDPSPSTDSSSGRDVLLFFLTPRRASASEVSAAPIAPPAR